MMLFIHRSVSIYHSVSWNGTELESQKINEFTVRPFKVLMYCLILTRPSCLGYPDKTPPFTVQLQLQVDLLIYIFLLVILFDSYYYPLNLMVYSSMVYRLSYLILSRRRLLG